MRLITWRAWVLAIVMSLGCGKTSSGGAHSESTHAGASAGGVAGAQPADAGRAGSEDDGKVAVASGSGSGGLGDKTHGAGAGGAGAGGTVGNTAGSAGLGAAAGTAGSFVEPPSGCAEKTANGPVNAQSDADLAALAGVTRLKGDLTIGGTTSNLQGLMCLTSINGSLKVLNTSALMQLSLPGLAQISGSFDVREGSALTRIAAPRLRSVGDSGFGSLWFSHIPLLTTVDLRGLSDVTAGIELQSLGKMADAPLTLDFTSMIQLKGSLSFEDIERLENLDGFSKLKTIDGGLALASLKNLASAVLPLLEDVSCNIDVSGLPILSTLDMHMLASVGKRGMYRISIQLLPNAKRIDLRSLRQISSALLISQVAGSTQGALVLDFSALTTLGDYLELEQVARLQNLDGFAKLTSIPGVLALDDNPELTSLAGLQMLQSLGGYFRARGNVKLPTCDAKALADRLKPTMALITGNLADGC